MRIIFIRSNPVNPDSRVEKEVNTLLKLGYEVQILAWDRNEKYEVKEFELQFEHGVAKVYRIGILANFGGGIKQNLRPLINFQTKIWRWLYKNRKKFDVIHACDFDTAFTAHKFAKMFKKKLVYDIFDYYVDAFKVPKMIKPILERLDTRIINTANAVIICSEQRKLQIAKANPVMLKVIHNTPPEITCENRTLSLNNEKIKLVYVGILSGGRFLKEISDFVTKNSQYELHIGGFGQLEEYFKEKSERNNNIKFYGKLPYNKTLELEKECDIMLAIYDPNNRNNQYAAPNKFYEALMLGKPLIMAKNTGMSEIIKQNKIGEVIEYNANSLEKAVIDLNNRKSEWDKISSTMKKLYAEKYNWSIMENRLERLYKNIL